MNFYEDFHRCQPGRLKIFHGLKFLEGNFLGARSAGFKAHMVPSHGALAHFQILSKLYLRAVLGRLRVVLAPSFPFLN